MVPILQQKLSDIQALCRANAVQSLSVFGSAARGSDFTAGSDVDFVYRFKDGILAELDYADAYFNLLFGLQNLLGRNVDLVAEAKLRNPYLKACIQPDLKVLYEA